MLFSNPKFFSETRSEPGADQLDPNIIFCGPRACFDNFVLEAGILFGKLYGHGSIGKTSLLNLVCTFLVLAHIIQVIHLNGFQHMPDLGKILCIQKPCHGFRHTADSQIPTVQLQGSLVQRGRHGQPVNILSQMPKGCRNSVTDDSHFSARKEAIKLRKYIFLFVIMLPIRLDYKPPDITFYEQLPAYKKYFPLAGGLRSFLGR